MLRMFKKSPAVKASSPATSVEDASDSEKSILPFPPKPPSVSEDEDPDASCDKEGEEHGESVLPFPPKHVVSEEDDPDATSDAEGEEHGEDPENTKASEQDAEKATEEPPTEGSPGRETSSDSEKSVGDPVAP